MLPSVITNTSAPELIQAFAAQWLAYALPYRRFAVTLADASARLGANADRYSFIVEDFHLLLFAGFDRRTVIQDYPSRIYKLSPRPHPRLQQTADRLRQRPD
jgi:hypothetical protein